MDERIFRPILSTQCHFLEGNVLMTTTSSATAGQGSGQVPQGYLPITVHLVVPDVDAAVRFYSAVFGANEVSRAAQDAGGGQRVWHCEVDIAGARLLLMEEFSDMHLVAPANGDTDPSHAIFTVFVSNVDNTYEQAIKAGGKEVIAPFDAFWGDRYAEFRDPSGHRWGLNRRQSELSAEEQASAGEQWRQQHGNAASPAPALQTEGKLRIARQ